MSMLDVAKYLSYSKSVDCASQRERFFNLSLVNNGHLFSCLHGDRSHWCFGREQKETEHYPKVGKGS